MSYEGFVQIICGNGHYFTVNAMDEMYIYGDDVVCHLCSAKQAWRNSVDDTNCESYGIIRNMEQFLITPAKVEVCNLGHNHIVGWDIFRIPTKEETENAREFLDPDGDFYPLKDYERVMKGWV